MNCVCEFCNLLRCVALRAGEVEGSPGNPMFRQDLKVLARRVLERLEDGVRCVHGPFEEEIEDNKFLEPEHSLWPVGESFPYLPEREF